MEAVLEWMKGIVILFVVLTALLWLVPKEQYKKYIRFFMELLIVLAVIRPVTGLIDFDGTFDEKIRNSQFMQEMENLRLDTAKLDFMQQDYRKSEYETVIAQDICSMAEGKAYEVQEIEVSLSEQYELDTVVLTLAAAQEEEDAADGEVKIENIVIGKNSEGENAATQTMLEQGARELKKEIMSYYQIRESQISILTEG